MKKKCFSALYAVICIGLAFVSAACGGKEASVDEFTKLGAADDAVVVSGHVSDILTNAACVAGAQGIELSPALAKIIDKGASPREKKEIDLALMIRGVDFDNCFFKLTPAEDYVLAFGLNDAASFRQWMVEDMECEAPVNEEGYNVYTLDSQLKLFATQGAAYLVYCNDGDCTLQAFAMLKEKASANPLAAWQIDALKQQKTCVALVNARKFIEAVGEANFNAAGNQYIDIETAKKGYAEITANLQGMKFNVEAKFRSAEGDVIKAKGDFKTIDVNVFEYINKSDNIVMALNLDGDIDWKQVITAIDAQSGGQLSRGSNKAVVDKVTEVLGNVDGTVFVAAHPKELIRFASGPQYWNATVGAQMKKGSAAGYIQEISALARNFGISVADESGVTVISLAPYTFYLKDVDGMFVLSTQPVDAKGGSIFDQSYFKGEVVALEAAFAEGTVLPNGQKLPFKPIIALSCDGETISFDVALVGEGKYLLDTLFAFIDEAVR